MMPTTHQLIDTLVTLDQDAREGFPPGNPEQQAAYDQVAHWLWDLARRADRVRILPTENVPLGPRKNVHYFDPLQEERIVLPGYMAE